MRTLVVVFFAFVPVFGAITLSAIKKIVPVWRSVLIFFQSVVVVCFVSALPFRFWLFTACSEEIIKLLLLALPLFILKKRDGENSPLSILAQGLILGLFVAGFESVLYTLRIPSLFFLRTMTAVPLHGALTVLSASALQRTSLVAHKNVITQYRFPRLLIAIVLHSLFNFFLEVGIPATIFVSFMVVIFSCSLAWYLWNKAASEGISKLQNER